MFKNVDIFIKEHKHINYCEAIIDRNGDISYASPSHIEALIRATGKTRDEIYNEMPVSESPIHWLVNKTGYICVWTKGYMLPKTMEYGDHLAWQQIESLWKLVKENMVSNTLF